MLEQKLSYSHLKGKFLVRDTINGKEIFQVEDVNDEILSGKGFLIDQQAFYHGIWDMGNRKNTEAKEADTKEIRMFQAFQRQDWKEV